MGPSEHDLIDQCQHGDASAFAALYESYAEKIYAFVYYRTLHRETAEDLVSEIFLKALEKIRTFSTEKGSFSSWLYRIARNTVIDHYRTRKVEGDVESVPGLSSREDIERDADVRQRLQGVEAGLRGLKPRQRELLVMRLWDGLSHREIADITGLTEANAKMTFSRALHQLRTELGISSLAVLLLMKTILWPH